MMWRAICVVIIVPLLGYLIDGASLGLDYSTNNLTCYDCMETFKNFWDPFTPCQSNLSSVPLSRCHSQDKYCRVDRISVKGMTTSISRGCTGDCIHGCRAYGYGITQLRCTSCCKGYACNTDNAGDVLVTVHAVTLLTSLSAIYFHVYS